MDDDFRVTHGLYEERRANLAWRVWQAWKNMRRSTRRLIREEPAEGRLLFYVLMADMVTFLSWTLKGVIAPTQSAGAVLPLQISILLVAMLFLRTSAMYVLSAVLGLGCRLFGGQGSWRDTRAGVFWGALVAAPLGLLASILVVVLSFLERSYPALGADWLTLPLYWLGMIPFVWFVAAGLAEAHRFQRTGPMFLALSILTIAAMFLSIYARAIGVL